MNAAEFQSLSETVRERKSPKLAAHKTCRIRSRSGGRYVDLFTAFVAFGCGTIRCLSHAVASSVQVMGPALPCGVLEFGHFGPNRDGNQCRTSFSKTGPLIVGYRVDSDPSWMRSTIWASLEVRCITSFMMRTVGAVKDAVCHFQN